MLEHFFLFIKKITGKIKANIFSFLLKKKFGFVGRNCSFRGWSSIFLEDTIRIGDNCWIEAITRYRDQSFSPSLQFGKCVMMSNNVHISCVSSIIIDDFVLIGSNVYIGDHSHGSLMSHKLDITVPPYMRDLDDIAPIYIGKNTWIGDGAIILAGAYICDGCVIGANAVVKGQYHSPCVIAGVPARSIKSLL
jgi:Acetyltransferase (isoleucine patch superfamily)